MALPGFLTRRSLALRLLLIAGIWSAVALAAAGVLLTELYRGSLIRSFDARLAVYEKTLAGIVAATPEGAVPDAGSLGEPRFLLPLTGWYWVVRDSATGGTMAASRSLFGEVLDFPPPPADGSVVASDVVGPAETPLRVVAQRVRIGGDRPVDIAVSADPAELDAEIGSFRLQAFLTLGVFAAGLMIAAVLQVIYGLKPLERMRLSLAAIRQGRAERLPEDLPREIAPLAGELNALIETNRAIVERANAHVGNLAHALKTPLSVILNDARTDGGPFAAKVVEQAGVMRSEVDRYLDRARMAAERRVVGATAEVLPVMEGVAGVLGRVYPARDIDVETDCPAGLRARIDRRDLQELVGNLMDNAAKYGRWRIRATAWADRANRADRPMATIRIEDDGPGLDSDARVAAVGRGRRLDESQPGSGLGLSIVDEIVEAYGGELHLGESPLGGLAVTVRLPQS